MSVPMIKEARTDLALSEPELMNVLRNSLYPGAKDDSIKLVIGYCKASGLDPMQKPVHIVPMWDSKSKAMRDVIMPGIGSYRTQAARSGEYAGISEPEFGPDITETLGGVPITYPAWCRVVVKRLLPNGLVAEFAAIERWKENYATAGRDSAAPNAMWKRRPYGQISKCFDSETEVLTTNGFEPFCAVTGSVMQVTDEGLEPCDARPFVQAYDGEMIVADGTRLNFSVTPNHDMLTTSGKIEAGEMFEQATKAWGKFNIPRAPHSTRKDAAVSDSVLSLLGYFLADGSHTGYRQFRISVSRDYKIDALRELALHQSEGIKRDAGRVAVANGREIVTSLDKTQFVYDFSLISQYVSTGKDVDIAAVLSLSQRQARVVVDALLEFDGSDNGVGVRRLSQRNASVLKAFEVMAVHAGYSISAQKSTQSDIGEASVVTVSSASHFPVTRGVENNKASLVKRMNVSGKVWCVTVPSGVIVVRRHGFSMLCGNCAEAQALRKAFPEFGAQPTADEMEGKSLDDGVTIIDGSTGEILNKKAAPKELPKYPDEKLEQSLPEWKGMINAGKSSAERIINKISSAYRLSDQQIDRILHLEEDEIDSTDEAGHADDHGEQE